jgi:hypothetical protein
MKLTTRSAIQEILNRTLLTLTVGAKTTKLSVKTQSKIPTAVKTKKAKTTIGRQGDAAQPVVRALRVPYN